MSEYTAKTDPLKVTTPKTLKIQVRRPVRQHRSFITSSTGPVDDKAAVAMLQRGQHLPEVVRRYSLGEPVVLLNALHQLAT